MFNYIYNKLIGYNYSSLVDSNKINKVNTIEKIDKNDKVKDTTKTIQELIQVPIKCVSSGEAIMFLSFMEMNPPG
jgi:hypothetical protein